LHGQRRVQSPLTQGSEHLLIGKIMERHAHARVFFIERLQRLRQHFRRQRRSVAEVKLTTIARGESSRGLCGGVGSLEHGTRFLEKRFAGVRKAYEARCAFKKRNGKFGFQNGAITLIEATPEGYREHGRVTPPNPPVPANHMEKAWVVEAVAIYPNRDDLRAAA
jgi:hypothetical protein